MTKDYRVTVKVRNNRLLSAMERAGYPTAAALSRALGGRNRQGEIGGLLAMTKSPKRQFGKNAGEWGALVVDICVVLRAMPDDLFNEEQQRTVAKNVAEFEMCDAEVAALIAPTETDPVEVLSLDDKRAAIAGCLATLSDRESEVLRRHYGIDGEEESLEQIGRSLDLSTERIRQIEARALRKMRQPSRAKPLQDVCGLAPGERPLKAPFWVLDHALWRDSISQGRSYEEAVEYYGFRGGDVPDYVWRELSCPTKVDVLMLCRALDGSPISDIAAARRCSQERVEQVVADTKRYMQSRYGIRDAENGESWLPALRQLWQTITKNQERVMP